MNIDRVIKEAYKTFLTGWKVFYHNGKKCVGKDDSFYRYSLDRNNCADDCFLLKYGIFKRDA